MWSARAAAFARCNLGGDHAPWDRLAALQLPQPRRGPDDHAEPAAADIPTAGADVDSGELIAAQLPGILVMHDASDGSQVGSCSCEPPRSSQYLSLGEDARPSARGARYQRPLSPTRSLVLAGAGSMSGVHLAPGMASTVRSIRSNNSLSWSATQPGRCDAAEEPAHYFGAFLQDRPELLPVHGLGDMAAGVANEPCDLLDRHAIIGQQRDERVPQVPRRPVPAEPGSLANVLEHLPDGPVAPSGAPVTVVNTMPVSCQCDPAASRSAAWSACHSLSAPTATCASFSARRDLGVLVSPPARSARGTATDGGSPSRSTSSSHPITRASSGRTPAIRHTTMQACISKAGRRGSFSPPCRSRAGGACVGAARPGGRRDAAMAAGHPSPVREHAPVVPGCGYRGLRSAFQKGHLAAQTWWAQLGSNQ